MPWIPQDSDSLLRLGQLFHTVSCNLTLKPLWTHRHLVWSVTGEILRVGWVHAGRLSVAENIIQCGGCHPLRRRAGVMDSTRCLECGWWDFPMDIYGHLWTSMDIYGPKFLRCWRALKSDSNDFLGGLGSWWSFFLSSPDHPSILGAKIIHVISIDGLWFLSICPYSPPRINRSCRYMCMWSIWVVCSQS